MKKSKWQIKKKIEDVPSIENIIRKGDIVVIKTLRAIFGYSFSKEKIVWSYKYDESYLIECAEIHEYGGTFVFVRHKRGKTEKDHQTIYTAIDIDGNEIWSCIYDYEPQGYKYFISIEDGFLYMKVRHIPTDYVHIARLSFEDGSIKIVGEYIVGYSVTKYKNQFYIGRGAGLFSLVGADKKKIWNKEVVNVSLYNDYLIFVASIKYFKETNRQVFGIFKMPLGGSIDDVEKMAESHLGSNLKFRNSIQIIKNRIIFFIDHGEGIVSTCLDTGHQWTSSIDEFTGYNMAFHDDRLYVISEDNNLGGSVIYEFEFDTGKLIGKVPPEDIPRRADNNIMVFSENQLLTSRRDTYIWEKVEG